MLPYALVIVTLQVLSLMPLTHALPHPDDVTLKTRDIAITTQDKIQFHDLEGNIISERYYTEEEVSFYRNSTTSTKPDEIVSRSSNDVLLWEKSLPTCVANVCSYTITIEGTYTGWNLCQDTQTIKRDNPLNAKGNACYTAWMQWSNWYWLDECDTAANWLEGKPGAYAAKLLTWNNKYVGNCYFTGHSLSTPSCGLAYPSFSSIIRCSVPA